MLQVRSFVPEDADVLGQLFYRAVQEGAAGAYSEAQRRAWCPNAPTGPAWTERLSKADCVVAQQNGSVVGFMTLLDTGYLDLAYVDPAVARRGIGTAMLAVLEGRGRAAGMTRMETEASLVAEGLFASAGWTVVKRQTIERGGVTLQNARMAKSLSD